MVMKKINVCKIGLTFIVLPLIVAFVIAFVTWYIVNFVMEIF